MFQQNGENVGKSRISELLKRNTALLLTHKKTITNVMLLGQAEREGNRDAQYWASSMVQGCCLDWKGSPEHLYKHPS